MKQNFNTLKLSQEEYPDLLRQIDKPPEKVYFRGDTGALGITCIAVVGTRKYSEYGEYMTRKIIEELSIYNITIVSGLAKGIDTIAHKVCLEMCMPTIAVLGSGINNIYPIENIKLAKEIEKKGLVISEYPDETPPLKHYFPQRNRIISGISIATLVIEAPERSGALITARCALEQGREIFAVPADIDRTNSSGIIKLLQKGAAYPVGSGQDIIETLKLQPQLFRTCSKGEHTAEPALSLTAQEELILFALSKTRGIPIDYINNTTNLSPQQVLTGLSYLEIKGLIKIRDGNYFRKC